MTLVLQIIKNKNHKKNHVIDKNISCFCSALTSIGAWPFYCIYYIHTRVPYFSITYFYRNSLLFCQKKKLKIKQSISKLENIQ